MLKKENRQWFRKFAFVIQETMRSYNLDIKYVQHFYKIINEVYFSGTFYSSSCSIDRYFVMLLRIVQKYTLKEYLVNSIINIYITYNNNKAPHYVMHGLRFYNKFEKI